MKILKIREIKKIKGGLVPTYVDYMPKKPAKGHLISMPW